MSLVFGLANEWALADAVGDAIRLIAPFLTSYVAFSVFARYEAEKLLAIAKMLLWLQGGVLMLSVCLKAYAVIGLGESLVSYAKSWIVVGFPLMAAAVAGAVGSPARLAILACGFASPILSASKALFLSFTAGGLAGVVHGRLLVLLIGVGAYLIAQFLERVVEADTLMSRISRAALEFVQSEADSSTGGRMTEATNALETLRRGLPITALFGMGAGALWEDVTGSYSGGLHYLNFRAEGGAHHIHLTYVAMLYRYGVPGFVLFAAFSISFLAMSLRFVRRVSSHDRDRKVGVALFVYGMMVVVYSLFDYIIYDSFEFSVVFAWLLAYVRARSAEGYGIREGLYNAPASEALIRPD